MNDGGTPGTDVIQTATMLAKKFDTSSGGNEEFSWTLEKSGSEVDLDFDDGSYVGPLVGTNGDVDEFQFGEIDGDSDYSQGMTDYGILIKEYNPDGSDQPNELSFEIPHDQRLAQVFVTLGDVTTVSGGIGKQVNPIGVGLAVLDKDAPAIGSENLIVVGGPCANSVAAELLGFPVDCGEGFESGTAVIQSFTSGSKVAILVAGYGAQDTLGASRLQ